MRKALITGEKREDFVSLFKGILARFGGTFTPVEADAPADRTGRYEWPAAESKHRLRYVSKDSPREVRDRSIAGRQRKRVKKAARRLRKLELN